MDQAFWHEVWASGRLGFHQGKANAMLTAHHQCLGSAASGSRVLVPLAGKAFDMIWLREQGYQVAAIELSSTAAQAFFEENNLKPTRHEQGAFTLFRAPGIDYYVGDIFDITPSVLGAVDGVYDRAAVVALPPHMRARYAAQTIALAPGKPQLVITFEYAEGFMTGPPFSVDAREMEALYGEVYHVSERERRAGDMQAVAWLLEAR